MAENSTFIKVDRNILQWRWYQDANTTRVFLHLLLTANIADHDFEKITIHRGEVATNIPRLSNLLKISIQSVKTALNHLKATGEITCRRYPHYQVITIPEYDRYQSVSTVKSTVKSPSTNRQVTGGQHQSKNNKNEKEGKNLCVTQTPSLAEAEAFFLDHGRSAADAGKFHAYNSARGWKIGRTRIEDWRSAAEMWIAQDADVAGGQDEQLDDFGRPVRKEFE